MNAINGGPEHQEIEALLPWYAAGTLSRRDANRVEQALAGDRELARQYDLVREELVDLGSRISDFLSSLTPRTLAWSATAAAVAILVQAAVIASVVVKEQGSPSEPGLASAPSEVSYAVVRFAPQATADDITKFLGAYKATVVEGPLRGQLYRIRLSETKLPKEEAGKIVRQMQSESNVVNFIAAKE